MEFSVKITEFSEEANARNLLAVFHLSIERHII